MRYDAPEHKPGDWVYDAHYNVRLVAVVWDEALHGYAGGWRYMVPGLSAVNLLKEQPGKPYMQYREICENGYELVGECSRDDHNIRMN